MLKEIVRTFKERNRLYTVTFLLVLLVFHGLNNYYILTESRYCLSADSVPYFSRTIQISQAFKNVELNLKSFSATYFQIFDWSFKPPLFFVTASPFLLFGTDKNIIIMSNLLYFAILLFATYGIGKISFNSRTVGLFSAFLVSMFPTVFAFSRVLMVDFALMALVALTFYLFLLNKFDNFRFSLSVGIVIGLGSLCKHSYFVFILPILFYFFLQKSNLKDKKILRNFTFSIILGLLIAANFYVVTFHETIGYVFRTSFQINPDPDPFQYLHILLRRQLLPVFFLLFLISSVYLLKKKKYFLPAMVLIPLILFSILPNKVDRFILPIFPYIAVSICGFIWSLSKARKALFMILVLFSILQYSAISYQNILPIPRIFFQKFLFGLELDETIIAHVGLLSVVDEGDWQSPGEEIIKIMKGNVEKNQIDRRIRVLFIGQTWRIHTTINYLRIIKKLPVELRRSKLRRFLTWPRVVDENFDDQIIMSDFIIVEEISPDNMWIHTDCLFKAFRRNFDKFESVETILFPNNSLCHVYKNRLFPKDACRIRRGW